MGETKLNISVETLAAFISREWLAQRHLHPMEEATAQARRMLAADVLIANTCSCYRERLRAALTQADRKEE